MHTHCIIPVILSSPSGAMRIASLLNLIVPGSCVSCNTYLPTGSLLCASCFTSIPIASTLICGACGLRLPEAKSICHPRFPYRFGAATDYRHPAVRALIHALKFERLRTATEPLAALLVRYAASLPISLALYTVVPVPLGNARTHDRGFNQAELISVRLANRLKLHIDPRLMCRVRETSPQSDLRTIAARKENIAGCFALRARGMANGGSFLLIDDVRTSGATLEEAARVLRDGGARRVLALTVAQA